MVAQWRVGGYGGGESYTVRKKKKENKEEGLSFMLSEIFYFYFLF